MSMFGLKLETDAKAQWLKALRSGNYKQAKHVLCRFRENQHSYCCLGVFANFKDIPFVDDEDVSLDREEEDSRVMGFNGFEAETLLPDDWFSQYVVDVQHEPDTVEKRAHELQSRLAQKNDQGMSFQDIADYIEANL